MKKGGSNGDRPGPKGRSKTGVGLFCLLPVLGCANQASDNDHSPTGTTLERREGLDAAGFAVIDEVCEKVDDANYLGRFETSMFRAVATVDEIAYLLDGSLLWVVSLADPTRPERVSLTRLPGHPVSVSVGDGTMLWIAAGEAGLLGVDIADPTAPALVAQMDFGANVLDVEWSEGMGYLALGSSGIARVALNEQGALGLVDQIPFDGFVADLAVANNKLFAAACDRVFGYAFDEEDSLSWLGSRKVPSLHGRAVTATENAVYVSAGEALYAYGMDGSGLVGPVGNYAEAHAEGFYVNDFVVHGNSGFIAAGDESVRVVDLSDVEQWPILHVEESEPDVELDDPIQLEMPTVGLVPGDPIAVGMHGDQLLVLGNYRWVGERLLRILDITDPAELSEIGSYAQPKRYGDVQQGPEGFWLNEVDGRILHVDRDLRVQSEWRVSGVEQSRSLGDILVYNTEDGELYCTDGTESYFLGPAVGKGSWVLVGEELFFAVPRYDALASVSLSDGCRPLNVDYLVKDFDFLGYARLGTVKGQLLAYDWGVGRLNVFDGSTRTSDPKPTRYDVGLCENFDWADRFTSAKDSQARFLPTSEGFALFCPSDQEHSASLRPFDCDDNGQLVERDLVALPAGIYSGAISTKQGWALVAFDNGRYQSELLVLDEEGQTIASVTYDGHAKGLVEVSDGYVVFDDDRGPLHYDPLSESLTPTELLETEGEAAP